MAIIEAICPRCGAVECRGPDFTLIAPDGTSAHYVFACPQCRLLVQKPADRRTVEILAEEGARRTVQEIPPEAFEPHDGPPFNVDDLLEFHDLLEQPQWFNALLASGP